MSNSPKVSKFRWTTGTAAKEDLPIAGTPAIWDCGNLIACNSKYVAFPAASAGSVAVLSHDKVAQRGFVPKKLFGQKGHVIDLAFNPFNDDLLFTGSEDGTIKGWKLPEDGNIPADTQDDIITLAGHSRKVGILAFHSSAENVLASAGMDQIINIWDITVNAPKITINQSAGENQIMSLNWNLDGSLLNITSKDKMVHILDSRTGAVVASGKANEGSKTMRSLWAKRRNQIVTFGFNKSQYRQMMLFDARDLSKPLFVKEVDQMSNIMLPFYDEDTSVLYVGGRGEAGIKYYELWDEATAIQPLQAFTQGDPQKGLAMMPKQSMDVKECQLNEFYKLTNNKLSKISFNLPRRQGATQFQSDIFPNTFAPKAAISADAFFKGTNANPVEISLAPKFEGEAVAVVAASGQLSSPSSTVPSSPVKNTETNNNSAAASTGKQTSPTTATATTTNTTTTTTAATVATVVEPAVEKSPIEVLTEKIAAQKTVVADAQKVFDAATSTLQDLEKQLATEQGKVKPAVPSSTATVAATVTVTVTEEEKTADVVEQKAEETASAVVEKAEEQQQQQQEEKKAEETAEEKKEDDI